MNSIPYLRFFLKISLSSLSLFCLPCLLFGQLNVSITPKNVNCFAGADGQAKANPSGGVSPYTYKWSNNGTTQTIQNLTAGIYYLTVTDANQQTKTATTSINQPAPLNLQIYSQSQLCDVAPDGLAEAVADGGILPYSYLWSNGGTTAKIEHLVAGTYTVTVTDANGCTTTGSTSLNYWADGVYLMTTFTPVTCAYEDGTAHVMPYSGTAPYDYQWSNGASTQDIENLATGAYSVTVTDVNGCVGHADVDVVSNTPLSILAILPTPFCLNTIAPFSMDPAPPIYPQIVWTLNDPLDQIISGQGTDSIQVQWATTGSKTVHYQNGANGIFCWSLTYGLEVVVCADAEEPWLAETSVSPNPFSDFVQVEFPAGSVAKAEAKLTDITGKIVLEKTLGNGTELFSTGDLPSGIYFLKIRSDKGERVWKLSKQ